jgi:hypothetical protein
VLHKYEVNDILDNREYLNVLEHLYGKKLTLWDVRKFHPVLYFYFVDSLIHIDYTLGLLTYRSHKFAKNFIAHEYMRWRIDEEKKGDRAKFPGFINWLKKTHPEHFSRLPSLWQMIYDEEHVAEYRGFKIVLDPDSHSEMPSNIFFLLIDEFFMPDFVNSIYADGSLVTLFEKYRFISTDNSI